MRVIIVVVILNLIMLSSCSSDINEGDVSSQQPNIIFIMADDFGRELLPAYGGESYETPVLEKMSEQGLTFTDTYATPMCAPSRMMLLTGQYNFRNYDNWDEMDFDISTIADYMNDAGYVTGMAGKWHRGGWGTDEQKGPAKAGFMNYSSYDYQEFHPNAFWDIDIWQDGESIQLGKYESSSDLFNNYLIDFIKDNKADPFFFYYSMNLVHRPFLPTPMNANIDEPHIREIITSDRGDVQYFSENVSYLDLLLGNIIEVLDEEGQINNTIIIFTADNGTDNVIEAKDLYSVFNDRFSPSAVSQTIQGGKYFPTELGVNVPFIIYAPGYIKKPEIIYSPIDFTDMLPTFFELGGGNVEQVVTDGLSFAPLIKGGEYNGREWIYSYGNFENNSSKYKDPVNNSEGLYHVLSDGKWKLYSDNRLFNIREDRLEENEIPEGFSEESDMARTRLKSQLQTLRDSTPKRW